MSSVVLEIPGPLVEEFVEEANPPNEMRAGKYEVDPTRMVACFEEVNTVPLLSEFHILLRDNRMVKVRGLGVKYLPNPSNPADCGSYAILPLLGPKDVFVAVFRASEVTGIFTGELQPARAD